MNSYEIFKDTLKTAVESSEYDFLNTDKHLGDNIIFLTLGGSHAYGTNVEGSDIDIRGCCFNSKEDLLGLSNFEVFEHTETDTVIYSINKLFNLLLNCNPNVIEMLGCKGYTHMQDVGRWLVGERKLFLSRKAIKSFGGYAFAQLNRLVNALGRNQDDDGLRENLQRSLQSNMLTMNERYSALPEGAIQYSIKNDDIVCDINLKDFPLNQFNGILNEQSNILKTYNKLNHRNTKKDIPHLCKHAMHLIRLFMMGIDILEKEQIITYREGNDHEILMDIRNGKYLTEDGQFDEYFDELLEYYKSRFDYASKNTSLPDKPDYARAEELLMSINKISLQKYFEEE